MEVKKYKSKDENDILDLFSLAFGKSISMKFWKWRYLNNPAMKNPLINLMWDQDKLVGHYAVSPVMLNINNKKVLTALSMTTMTHPEYAGKGIFTELAEKLYQDIYKKENIQAVWGFPNLNSHYGLNKRLKWKDISIVPTLKLSSKCFSKYKKIEYQITNNFSNKHVEKIKKNNQGEISVDKNVDYLNWRYRDHPDNDYYTLELSNYDSLEFVVIKIINSFDDQDFKEVDIFEHGYEANPEIIFDIICAVVSFIDDRKTNVKSLNTWMPLFDNRHILLERNRFKPEKHLTFMGFRPFTSKYNLLGDFSKWDLTMGDSDVY